MTELFTQSRGQGKDLVLLHGWGLNSGVWEPLIGHLSTDFRVTTIDLPGFGRNVDAMPEDYSIEEVARQVAEHLPSDCILLGWSMGGLVAQQIALTSPQCLNHLVLVASSPHFPNRKNWPGIKPQVLSMFQQQLQRDFAKTLDRFLAIQALGSPSARADIRLIRDCIEHYPLPAPQALVAGLQLLAEVDLRKQIGQTVVPTTRIYGRLDSLVPKQAIANIAALHPQCHSKVMEHAAHAPFISHPQSFAELLRQFCV